MGGESPVPSCQHGRHDSKLEGVPRPGDGVDPPVHPEKDPRRDPMPDGLFGEPERGQLSESHKAMLATGPPEKRSIIHGDIEVTRGRSAHPNLQKPARRGRFLQSGMEDPA